MAGLSSPCIRNGKCTCGNKCKPNDRGKHPRITKWPQLATTEEATIRAWWKKWPDANIAIATGKESGIAVLDADPKGKRYIGVVAKKYPNALATLTSSTGRGKHRIFQYPEDYEIKNSAGEIALGIDIRGEKGYFIAPPSVHYSGATYTWDDAKTPIAPWPELLTQVLGKANSTPAPEIMSIDSPEILSQELKKPAKESTGLTASSADSFLEGQRNVNLASLGGYMRRRGMSVEAITAALLEENKIRCSPPLSEAEVQKIAASVSTYAPAQQNGTRPVLDSKAMQGLAGKAVKALEPFTESDSAAMLLQLLTLVGNIVGKVPHFKVEADTHCLNIFTVLVGTTSNGRKGTSLGQVKKLVATVDPGWIRNCEQSGLSSGEGLIHAVRDATANDAGAKDKRLQVVETEFARVLKNSTRPGNTLSEVIRQSWDSGKLRVMNKNTPEKATNAHISIIAHITSEELRAEMRRCEMSNGFANRFLWVLVGRSKILSEGGSMPQPQLESLQQEFKEAVEWAQGIDFGELNFSENAAQLWRNLYPSLGNDAYGLLGKVTSRAAAQIRRVAAIYAILEKKSQICQRHLEAAVAVWQYCEESARIIFGDTGKLWELKRKLEQSIKDSANGMTQTEITKIFSNHPDPAIATTLEQLEDEGKIIQKKQKTEGRPVTRWVATGMEKP